MITELQKRTVQAIVNIFETGKPFGDYGKVTCAEGDRGGLSYGRCQATIASGNLERLLREYCERGGIYADGIREWLCRMPADSGKTEAGRAFRKLLVKAGSDPVMRAVQDAYFDRNYWTPAMNAADRMGITLPLGAAVVYDSRVHGSFALIRKKTDRDGTVREKGEKRWITQYLALRKEWLETSRNALLRNSAYRMDALSSLIQKDNWDLKLPLVVRGIIIHDGLFEGNDEKNA